MRDDPYGSGALADNIEAELRPEDPPRKPISSADESQAAAELAIEPIEIMALQTLPEKPPARRWVIEDWIGRGYVTALFGRGGAGKSTLALQMAVSVALGKPALGVPTTPGGRVLAVFCEDDADELHRRLFAISNAHDVSVASLAGQLDLSARVGEENTLMGYPLADQRSHQVVPASLYWRIEANLRGARTSRRAYQLLILDNISQLFAISQSDSVSVTQAVNRLTRLAIDFDLGILLLGHTAKSPLSEYAGSAAWNDAVRARLFLARADEEGVSSDELVLGRMKANYAATDSMSLRYDGGVFRTIGSDDIVQRMRKATREREADNAVLAIVTQLSAQETNASHRPSSRNYLPRLAEDRKLVLFGLTKRDIEAAMLRLITDKRLEVESYKAPDRKTYERLRVAARAA